MANDNFADSEIEAKKRFNDFQNVDPFPNIQTGLLNSRYIYDYVKETAMVWPFSDDDKQLRKKLKPASYEIDFLGTVFSTDENGNFSKQPIEVGTRYNLKSNSIIFISLKTQFFLPNYIAIRFNLRINLVHRGLLLGTGPLVDPGFSGNLLIPLHNLTSVDYPLIGGEGLIWVEFTKLALHQDWAENLKSNTVGYSQFPDSKRNLKPEDYFDASYGRPAASSIPGEVTAAKKSAEKAERYAKVLTGIGLLGLISILAATWNLISTANQNLDTARDLMSKLQVHQVQLDKEIESLQKKVDSLSGSLPTVSMGTDLARTHKIQNRSNSQQ